VPATVQMWRDAVARYERRLDRVAEKHFEEIDATVVVWRDLLPPPHLGLHGND
jgi:hypothetical protein